MTRALVLISLLQSYAAGAVHLVGMTVPPLPESLREMGGTCLGDLNSKDVCGYSIGMLGNNDGVVTYLYIGSNASSGEKGETRWLITDQLSVPAIAHPYVLTNTACRYKGISDTAVVAIVKDEGLDKEWLKAKDWAYRADLNLGRFVRLAAKDVDCYNTAREAD